MNIYFIYECSLCHEQIKSSKPVMSDKSYQHALSVITEGMNSGNYLYNVHDCKGDQSVYGVARLVGISK